MSTEPEDADYTIAAVSKLSGISCHALRVWERRYGFPVPRRSASGHRRYGREQVRILRRISELSRLGRSIGEVIADVLAGRLKVEDELEPDIGPCGKPTVAGLINRLAAGDAIGGGACYEQLARNLETEDLVAQIIGPALVDVGERWFRRECSVFQEHFVSGFLRTKLSALIEQAHQANRRPTHTIVVGTVRGDRHEGGVLMLHLLLEQIGWRVINLGVDLPVAEYAKAINAWRPEALGLSFVLSRNIKKRFQELSQIHGLPILVGGRSILNYQSLARRHGLIPLPGSLPAILPQLCAEFEDWVKTSTKPSSAP